MKALQLGILGVSNFFQKRIAIPVSRSPLIEIAAIASRSKDRAQEAAQRYGIARAYGSYEALLEDTKVEAVYIPLPNHLHASYIKKAADAGKHVICEKPIALNATEAADCIAYATGKGLKVMEAFMYKFHPQWQHVRSLLQMQEIGKVQSIYAFFGYHNTDLANIRNQQDTGGGALLDIGCYAVSCSRFLLDAEPKRVISLAQFDKQTNTDILMSGILDFDKTHAQFTVATRIFPYQRVDIHGSSGSVSIDIPFNTYADAESRVVVRNSVGTREVYTGPEDQYILEFEAFARAIRENKPLPNTPNDAIHNMRALDALMESAQSGAWTTVDTAVKPG